MKIFNAEILRQIDKLTIEKQGITSLELMEKAALQVFLWLVHHFTEKKTTYYIFCGVGNNGGDGLVIARMLKQNYFDVHVFIVPFSTNYSDDFNSNIERLKECNLTYEVIDRASDFPVIPDNAIIIDAIFGTGLSRDLDDRIQKFIQHLNYQKGTKISIDVPSGMFIEKKTEIAIESDILLTFQLPKLPFYFKDNECHINEIVFLDIGLDREALNSFSTMYQYIDEQEVKLRYKPISRISHKGTQGHVLLIGGSYGKIGSMILASRAALKSGCGLVTAYLPKCGYEIVQTAFPEAMVITDENHEYITNINFEITPKAIGIGMGLGQEFQTQKGFHEFLKSNKTPLVIDADALNILSNNKEWLTLIPENSILTPHPKELERLIGTWTDDFDRIEKVKSFSEKYNVVVVVKGSHTFIYDKENIFVNGSGNQALATGGSGDVLAGMIASFLAQKYSSVDAAILGVYFHGRTADLGIEEVGYEGFIASDIINYLGKVFWEVKLKKPSNF